MRVSITSLVKTYGGRSQRFNALSGVDVEVEQGEMVCLVGPSGCGKTTLLRSVAGLVTPDAGRISIGDRTVFGSDPPVEVKPEDRQIGMVFQSYALWPHLRVEQNVAYPLKMRRRGKAVTAEAVRSVLELVGCGQLAHRFPSELSGGQQQRVALARALVAEPALVLFDEPLSNLDVKLRQNLRYEIHDLQQRVGFTGLYVTHDQEEAWALADRVVVMRDGRVVQHGRPREIYRKPATEFVARFIGDMNLQAGEYDRSGSGSAVVTGHGHHAGCPTTDRIRPGDQVFLAVAEDHVKVGQTAQPGVASDAAVNRWPSRVRQVVDLGRRQVATVELVDQTVWHVPAELTRELRPDDDVVLECAVSDTLIVAADASLEPGG